MKKIALINFYFGKIKPEYMDFYLSSVSYNKDIDLFLFTNLNIDANYENIKIVKMEFEDFTKVLKNKIEFELSKRGINDKVNISSAYKIADFRPAFGFCFQEYIKDYDFWGGSDLDLIFGDIRKYVPDNILEKYDKCYEHGHFFLIRNTEECNLMFLENYKNSFYNVLHLPKNTFFEEIYEKKWMIGGGINSIFDKRKKLYKNRKALCDISFKYHNLLDLKNPVSSKKIVFVFDEGKLYRVYYKKEKIVKEEVFYAHFQKRKLKKNTDDIRHFYIDNNSFNSIEKSDKLMFKNTKTIDLMTYKYFKFRYLDCLSRKINGDFKIR